MCEYNREKEVRVSSLGTVNMPLADLVSMHKNSEIIIYKDEYSRQEMGVAVRRQNARAPLIFIRPE